MNDLQDEESIREGEGSIEECLDLKIVWSCTRSCDDLYLERANEDP